MQEQIEASVHHIRSIIGDFSPATGIILGTGLGALAAEITLSFEIPYTDLPHFAVSTVESHKGRLLFGTLGGKNIVCMQGRFHYYEGYSMEQITFPVRVMKALGVHNLLVSNAAGGLNPEFEVSDLMLITDHISLFLPANPFRGSNSLGLNDRFPDMCDPYDPRLAEMALEIASENDIWLKTGVYVSVPGPQLETRAEYRMLRLLQADAVGMSTVPEIMVAHAIGLRCLGVSVITDLGLPDTLQKANIQHIIAAAHKAEPQLTRLFKELIRRI